MVFLAPVFASAQSGKQALTITPPLIKNNAVPGQIWKSYVKVVNNNDFKVNVYNELRDFRGGTESGTVDFLNIDENNPNLLSNWIEISVEPVELAPFESKEIPFVVEVPEDASPGGHYTAILLGTRPMENENGGSVMKVSSMLASLILLNVEGDVEESGRIREFSTNKSFYTDAKVLFDVRFENTGNVHVQPQGEIRIYDWFGNDKGVLNINHNTEFGNVLPKTIRRWNFTWEGGNNLLEMGRYKASLIMGFGESARQTINRDHYFWIINIKLLLFTVVPIIVFVLLIILIIKAYIKRAIRKTKEELGLEAEAHKNEEEDLVATEDKKRAWPKFLLAVIIFLLIVLAAFWIVFYVSQKNNEFSEKYKNNQNENIEPKVIDFKEDEKEDEVEDKNSQEAIEAGEEDEDKNEEKEEEDVFEGPFSVTVLNGSGVSGAAGSVAEMLKNDYTIGDISNADAYEYAFTFIKYKKGLRDEAVKLKEFFSEEAEIREDNEMEEDVVIIVGKDYEVK